MIRKSLREIFSTKFNTAFAASIQDCKESEDLERMKKRYPVYSQRADAGWGETGAGVRLG
jgi:hypothetical protein